MHCLSNILSKLSLSCQGGPVDDDVEPIVVPGKDTNFDADSHQTIRSEHPNRVEGDMDNAGFPNVPRSGSQEGAHTPGSSSVPPGYGTFPDQRTEQSSTNPTASPSEEVEKSNVQTHQESNVLEDHVITTQQGEGFEPGSASLPDSKAEEVSLEERHFGSRERRASKSTSLPEVSSQAHLQDSANQDHRPTDKRKLSMPLLNSLGAKEHVFKEWPGQPSTGSAHDRTQDRKIASPARYRPDYTAQARTLPSYPQTTDSQTSRAPAGPNVPHDNRTFKQGNGPSLGSFKRKKDEETHQEGTLHKKTRKSAGLMNLGNTCYMNSILQCLYHTTELTEFLLSEDSDHSNTKTKGPVTKAFTELLKRMKNCTDSEPELRELKRVAGERDPEFAGSMQREAHDFLAMMQTWLSKELEEPDTEELKIEGTTIPNFRPSFPVDLFNGVHCSTFICERKNRVILRKYEPFSNLTLAVTSMSSSMEDVLRSYYETQVITWNCKLCHEDHECRHETKIYRLPPVLIVHFSRYNLSAIGTSRKAVVYRPPVLKLDTHLHSDVKRGQEYELYAFCTHEGRMTGGHYIAHHMDPPGKWTLFDDSYVEHNVEANINKAHILFYRARRRDLVTTLSEIGLRS